MKKLQQLMPEVFTDTGKLSLSKLDWFIGAENIEHVPLSDNSPACVECRNRDKESDTIDPECIFCNQKLTSITSNLPGFVYRCRNDKKWTILDISDGCETVTGYSRNEFVDLKTVDFNDIICPEERDLLWNEWQKILPLRSVFEYEYRITAKDGQQRWVWERGRGIFGKDDSLLYLEGFISDITERKQTEEKLLHTARLYALMSQINQAIIKTDDENLLFQSICKVAIDYGKFRMAWIGKIDENDLILKPVFHAGYTDGYLDRLIINTGPEDTGNGPSGKAIRSGHIICCSDIATDPIMKPWTSEALKRGYRASAAIPFSRKGKVVGTLNLYASEAGFFTPDEEALLQEIGDKISFTLNAFHSEIERRKAEEALQKSEALHRAILNASPDIVAITDLDQRIVMISPISLAMFGYISEDEVLGKNICEFLHPDDVEKAIYYLNLLFNGTKTGPIEYRGITKHGDIIPIEANAEFIEDQNGNPTQLVFIIRDNTLRKSTEDALKESESRYRTLVENSTDAIAITQKGIISFVNREFIRLLGIPSEINVIGRPILNFVHPDYHEFVKDRIKDITITERQQPSAEEVYIRYDGTSVEVEVKSICINLGDSKSAQVIIKDITEQKKAEKLIRESHLRLENIVNERTTELKQVLRINRAIIDTASIAIVSADRKGIILSVNPFAEKLMGYANNEMPGMSFQRLFRKKEMAILFGKPHKNTTTVIRQYLGSILLHKSKIIETNILNKDGEVIPVLFSVSVVRDKAGRLEGFTGIAVDISERKKAEKALHKSQKELVLREIYLQSVIDNHPGRFWMKDLSGKYLLSNQTNNKYLRYTLGIPNSDIVGKTEKEIRPLAEAKEINKEDRDITSKNKVIKREEKVRLGSKDFWFEELKYPVVDGDGHTIGIAGYALDVTERKDRDAQLRMRNEAFESFALSIIITNNEGIIQWTNSAFHKLTGYTTKEVIGRRLSTLNEKNLPPECIRKVWDTLEAGDVWHSEFVNKRKDGTSYFAETTITPVRDDMEEISNFIAIEIDITHRKQMEDALRSSEERWQFALEGAGDGVWDFDVPANKEYFSRQWKGMLGYKEDEIGNEVIDWSSRVHPDDLKQCYDDLDKHISGKADLYINEHRLRCKDGTYKWILSRGKIISRDSEGNPLRIIGTHTDITASKKLEESLRKSIEKEKEINELKSRFVANASHEFRTPLASILITNDALINYWTKMETDQIKTKLEKIKTSTIHLTQIVNDILLLSKLQEGKLEFSTKAIDIVELCHEIATETNEQTLNRIQFSSEIQTQTLRIDERHIRQAITNLLTNALKYSPDEKKVEFTIKKAADKIEITISDKGIGIPEADQKHLFTPFFRASNSRLIPGNGLGLNILRESILKHGGNVTFVSEINKGSSFTIHLPLLAR